MIKLTLKLNKSFALIVLTLLLPYFVSSKPVVAAEEPATCNTPPMLEWIDKPSTNIVPLNSAIKLKLKNSDPPHGYVFEYRIEDKSSNKVIVLAKKTMTASETESSIFSLTLNTPGDKSIYAYYEGSENGSCYNTSTNYFNFAVRSNQGNANDITVSASGNVNQGQNKEITFNAKNFSGWLAVLYINIGGKDCINATGTKSCWSEKWRKTLDSNDFNGSYTWTTSNSTLLGPHPIKLEVFNGSVSVLNSTTVSVCNAAGTNCVGDTGSSGGTGTGGTDGSGGTSGGGSADIGSFSNLNKTLTWLITGSDSGKDMSKAELSDIKQVVIRTTNYALDVAGVIAIIILLYSAFMYATAFGEESKAEAAKKALTWSIIGMIIIILSKSLMLFINNSLKTGL